MFSQTMEYALRIMVYLASLSPAPTACPGQSARLPTIAQIAAATQTPVGYLAKVLRNLARAGLIRSRRGLHGGSVLARGPGEISVLDVVQAVDPILRIRSCPLGLKSHGVNLCPLHRRLDVAIGTVEQVFGNTTLAELVADSSPIRDRASHKSAKPRHRSRVGIILLPTA